MNESGVRLAFDLDGVLVGKPPIIPKAWLEFLYRGRFSKDLSYRLPNSKIEIWLRKLSHFYLLRPPISRNIAILRQLEEHPNLTLYAVSSRYSFLEPETKAWLKKRHLDNVFEKVFINLANEQPHLFKKRILQKLEPDYYFEDDPQIVAFLQDQLTNSNVVLANRRQPLPVLS